MSEQLQILNFSTDFSDHIQVLDFLTVENLYGNFVTSYLVKTNCKVIGIHNVIHGKNQMSSFMQNITRNYLKDYVYCNPPALGVGYATIW